MPTNNWKPVDWVVVALTVSIVAGITVAVVGVNIRGDWNQERGELIASTIAGILAIISMYVGASIQRKRDKDDPE